MTKLDKKEEIEEIGKLSEGDIPPAKKPRLDKNSDLNKSSSLINFHIIECITQVQNAFIEKLPISTPIFKSISSPFSAIQLFNVFDENLLKQVLEEMNSLHFTKRSNDLFEFEQSNDLKSDLNHTPFLSTLRECIYSHQFLNLISQITGIQLDSHPDLSAHKYSPGGYLLCHDDDIKESKSGRRIAFILYLVPSDWDINEGGRLDLYNINDQGMPKDITASILPLWNSLAFFELSPTSFHQVSEITGNRSRYSISGWFHGSLNNRLSKEIYYNVKENSTSLDILNSDYTNLKSIQQIQDKFNENSSIQLHKFLKQDIVKGGIEKLSNSLESNPLLYQYHIGKVSNDILETFSSKSFKEYLSKITNLNLDTFSTIKIRIFSKGDYTLLHDEAQEDSPCLDIIYTLGAYNWDESWGGGMHYVADKENLITFWPGHNILSLVYRSREDNVLRFVKYVNSRAEQERGEIIFSYKVLDD